MYCSNVFTTYKVTCLNNNNNQSLSTECFSSLQSNIVRNYSAFNIRRLNKIMYNAVRMKNMY